MSEDGVPPPKKNDSCGLLAILAVIMLAAVVGMAIGGLIWCSTLNKRMLSLEATQADDKQQNAKLAALTARLRETDARLKVATDELSTSLGLTQKQLDARAEEIIRREEADSQRLESAQKQTAQQVSAVSSEVSHVKTDVGGVKTDVSKTQSDLATTINQLQSMNGDLSGHSRQIARNHDELELLKHKGDRLYYEFILVKGQKKPVGSVSLELKKADAKKNRFTLTVYSNDKEYEKKDRNLNELLQFYSGKDSQLFEIVVNAITAKDTVTGYLSTPKNEPASTTAQ